MSKFRCQSFQGRVPIGTSSWSPKRGAARQRVRVVYDTYNTLLVCLIINLCKESLAPRPPGPHAAF